MNCPSRTDNVEEHPSWNQSPNALSADLTTREDFNGIVNIRQRREAPSETDGPDHLSVQVVPNIEKERPSNTLNSPTIANIDPPVEAASQSVQPREPLPYERLRQYLRKVIVSLQRYAKFVGPGFLIAVAYIDPGNYATDVQAGAATKYRHLFIVLMSNLFAIFLQSLCIKLGSVTGLNLAENCRKHLPPWLNIVLYIFAEAAIIATDIAEVSGDDHVLQQG
jgi:metal iron transporter